MRSLAAGSLLWAGTGGQAERPVHLFPETLTVYTGDKAEDDEG